MAAIEHLSVALPVDLALRVKAAVDAGEYASSSDLVGDALREWSDKRRAQQDSVAELREAWQQAYADVAPGEPADAVLDELEGKYAGLAGVTG